MPGGIVLPEDPKEIDRKKREALVKALREAAPDTAQGGNPAQPINPVAGQRSPWNPQYVANDQAWMRYVVNESVPALGNDIATLMGMGDSSPATATEVAYKAGASLPRETPKPNTPVLRTQPGVPVDIGLPYGGGSSGAESSGLSALKQAIAVYNAPVPPEVQRLAETIKRNQEWNLKLAMAAGPRDAQWTKHFLEQAAAADKELKLGEYGIAKHGIFARNPLERAGGLLDAATAASSLARSSLPPMPSYQKHAPMVISYEENGQTKYKTVETFYNPMDGRTMYRDDYGVVRVLPPDAIETTKEMMTSGQLSKLGDEIVRLKQQKKSLEGLIVIHGKRRGGVKHLMDVAQANLRTFLSDMGKPEHVTWAQLTAAEQNKAYAFLREMIAGVGNPSEWEQRNVLAASGGPLSALQDKNIVITLMTSQLEDIQRVIDKNMKVWDYQYEVRNRPPMMLPDFPAWTPEQWLNRGGANEANNEEYVNFPDGTRAKQVPQDQWEQFLGRQ